MSNITPTPIAVLDFGSQFTHLITRRLRDAGIYCEIFAPSIDADDLIARGARGIVMSGGPASVYDHDRPRFNERILDLDLPILGICYGFQLMAHLLGGEVVPGHVKEFGRAELLVNGNSLLFDGLDPSQVVWMSHGDTVARLPPGFSRVASTADCPNAAAEASGAKRYGIQFHSEVAHTLHGAEILANFALRICKCTPEWDSRSSIDLIADYIRESVGDRNVFVLVSGGVDSTVLFLLLNRVLGQERVRGLSVDTGLLRPADVEFTKTFLDENGMDNCTFVDARDEFLNALDNVADPEQKRTIIGRLFLDVKDRALAEMQLEPQNWLLAQGTIYPDVITSGASANASVIKTHHNAVPSLEGLEVLEPLRFLYKDEVRRLSSALGLPHEFTWKHPFPGPGIAVRIAGRITPSKISLYHVIDEIVLQSIRRSGWYERLWMGFPVLINMPESTTPDMGQANATREEVVARVSTRLDNAIFDSVRVEASVLPIRSVGVKGDYRTYEHPVELRFTTESGSRYHVPHDILEAMSTEIANRTSHVNRVLLAINWSGDPSGWRDIVVLRMLLSVDTLTADWAKLEHALLDEMAAQIRAAGPSIDAVLLDITQKPPGTMEWE